MKRYISILIALVAIAMGAKAAVTDYGFKIGGVEITSDNYVSESSNNAWYYDPANNVLHFTDGSLRSYGQFRLLDVNSDVNPTLTIQVDGNCITKELRDVAIYFMGEGTHTICGEGMLSLEPELINLQGIIRSIGNTKLTIKDLTLNITTFGSGDMGFLNTHFSELILDHCEINIKSSYCAWFGNSSSNSSVDPVLKDCYLVNGVFYGGGVVEYVGSGEWLNEVSIKRSYPITNVAITLNNPTAGEVVPNSCQIDNEHCTAVLSWEIVNDNGSFNNVTPGSVFELGEVYRAVVLLTSKDGKAYPFSSDASITINGHQAAVNVTGNSAAVATYTFPRIPDTFYDLWVSDQPVKESNRNAIPVSHGTCSYNPDTKTLTLNNVNYTNSNENSGGTVSGYGIYSNIDNLTINLEGSNYISSTHGIGLFSMKNLTITGNGILFIGANEGTALAMGSYGSKLNIMGGAQVLTQGMYGVTGGIHTVNVGGEELIESYVTTLSVSSPDALLRAYGTQQCVKDIPFLGEGMEFICENNPNVKLYHKNRSICYYERNRYFPYSNDWIKMTNPNGGISTGLEAIDNGELTIDSSVPLYNLQGQRVSHPVKGQIYIQNGRKVKF
ncbi:MAG: hypothetical protein IKH99_10375 [Prevotella sp.]|nr:hypothetical protein [Prevotella sp.]